MRTTMVRNKDVPVQLLPVDYVGDDNADSAVAVLFQSHRLAMVRLAVLLVDDVETAEDVVQEAFAALHRRWRAPAGREAAVGHLAGCGLHGPPSGVRRRPTVRRHPLPHAATPPPEE